MSEALYDSGGIRRFSNLKIQSAIDSALAESKPEDKVVVVAHHVYNNDGTVVENVTKLSALVKLPGGFSVMAAAYKDWGKGDIGAEGKIVFKL
jgi:hypothetical protein